MLFTLFLIVNNQTAYANKDSSSWASLKYNKTYYVFMASNNQFFVFLSLVFLNIDN